MPFLNTLRPSLFATALVALLAACGSGSVVSDLTPKRFITVGDGFMDVGQAGYRYTVNDGSNIWVQDLAAHYQQTITSANSGGWGYAQGGARVAAADAGGAPSVTAQIDAVLARTTFNANDDVVVVVNLANKLWTKYRIGMPGEGNWALRFNSDAKIYSDDYGDLGSDADAFEENGQTRVRVSIAPYSVLVYGLAG